jgi:hypothetical protein
MRPCSRRAPERLGLLDLDDPDLVSFWCPNCSASYCRTHWVLETEYDDGFYDYTQGTCAAGHSRMVDD